MLGYRNDRVVCLLLGGDGRQRPARPTFAYVARMVRLRIAAVIHALAF
jgi:hypothetical protein